MSDRNTAPNPLAIPTLTVQSSRSYPRMTSKIIRPTQAETSHKVADDTRKPISETRTVEWLQLGANVIVAIIGLGAVIVYGNQLHEMQTQTKILSDQFELTDRPWIRVAGFEPMEHSDGLPQLIFSSFSRDDPLKAETAIAVKILLANTGKNPAINASVRGELFFPEFTDAGTEVPEEKRFCESVRAEVSQFSRPDGEALFTEDKPVRFVEFQGHATISSTEKPNTVNSPYYTEPVIIGCITYRFNQSSRLHQTRFEYNILPIDAGSSLFPVGVSVLHVRLVRIPDLDYYD